MSSEQHHDYHLVDPSPWPLLGSLSALFLATGALFFIHDKPAGNLMLPVGFGLVIFTMYVWWKDVIKEGKTGHHTSLVRHGLRVGMALFILSEVMFFFAFFWSFFKSALLPVLDLNTEEFTHVLEPGFEAVRGAWPPAGIETFNAWDLPFINTLVLLLSGTTVTWAHYALIKGKQKELVQALTITVALGLAFTALQAYEYSHAAFGFKDGIYASNFYMATGFHGAHVIIGTIFLAVCLVRARRGSLTKQGHLGFEFAAWYWHFVDVVWLFLFAFVYVWGS